MKAEIDEKGQMTITAETPIEAYALRQWAQEAFIDLTDRARVAGEIGVWRSSSLMCTSEIGDR